MTSPSLPTTPILPAFVALPGGVFTMGNAKGRPDERPEHQVELSAFRAAQAPVTNAEYARFVAATGAERPRFAGDERFDVPAQPVVGVSWHEAVAYCGWLAQEVGLAARLPTEAEREFAALGGMERHDWPWPGASHTDHPLAHIVGRRDRPHEPHEACANGYGLRCMAENVHEWCSDWYDPGYYPRAPRHDPAGPATGRRKSNRGGSWRHSVKFTRVSARASLDPTFRYNDFGFRVYADGAEG